MTTTPLTDELVLETLRQVIDPELGVNIVDLGLVYRYAYAAGKLTVTMTLTTPGCPMHDSIAEGVKNILLRSRRRYRRGSRSRLGPAVASLDDDRSWPRHDGCPKFLTINQN